MDLGSIPREALALALVVAVAIAVVQGLVLAAGRWVRRRRLSVRRARAVVGEKRASVYLEGAGYAVLGAQAVAEHVVCVDGREVIVSLRADYLAERDGLRYAVEVKTGVAAPRIETSATRRQILEYRVAFDVDGVLLVDAETGRVHEITFPALSRLSRPSRRPLAAFWRAVALAVAVAAAAAAALALLTTVRRS